MPRSVAVWFGLLVVAVANGALREALLTPKLGDRAGHAASTLILSGAILLVTWLTIGWIRPATRSDSFLIGALWVALTVAFEFLAGHYLFGNPWSKLLADYDLLRGRIWVLVLITTGLAPWAAASMRGLFR